MFNVLYKFFIPHGELILYGDNLKACKPYIDNVGLESVEDLCLYCKQHGLRIYHNPQRSLRGFLTIPRVLNLTRKYSVHSSWNDVLRYIQSRA